MRIWPPQVDYLEPLYIAVLGIVTLRFTTTFSDDRNTITGRWEIAEDGVKYTTDFDIFCRSVDT